MILDEDVEHAFASLQTFPAMERFLNVLFGPGSWTYDATADVWLVPDSNHPGRYLQIKRGGTWTSVGMQ